MFRVNVSDAERVGGVGGSQFVDVEGLELALGLLVEDGVPLAIEHVADFHLILATGLGIDINRIFLLGA